MSTPNKYANLGGTKVFPVCPCEDKNCPYVKGKRAASALITHYQAWGTDHILLTDGRITRLPKVVRAIERQGQ